MWFSFERFACYTQSGFCAHECALARTCHTRRATCTRDDAHARASGVHTDQRRTSKVPKIDAVIMTSHRSKKRGEKRGVRARRSVRVRREHDPDDDAEGGGVACVEVLEEGRWNDSSGGGANDVEDVSAEMMDTVQDGELSTESTQEELYERYIEQLSASESVPVLHLRHLPTELQEEQHQVFMLPAMTPTGDACTVSSHGLIFAALSLC